MPSYETSSLVIITEKFIFALVHVLRTYCTSTHLFYYSAKKSVHHANLVLYNDENSCCEVLIERLQ